MSRLNHPFLQKSPKVAGPTVVKVGSSTLKNENGDLNLARIAGLVEALVQQQRDRQSCILVTSGAVAVGASVLNRTYE